MDDPIDEPLRLPAPPPAPPRPTIPIAAAIVPIVGAVVLWRVTGSTFALWFAALGPLMAVAGIIDGLRTSRRAKRRSSRESAAAIRALDEEIEERHGAERRRAWRRTPDVAGYAVDVDEVWRVVPGRSEVLVVGRGSGGSDLRVEGEAHDPASRDLRRRARVLDDAPMTVPMSAGVAVSGPPLAAAAVLRALALQTCLARAPGSVRLVGEAAELAAVPHRAATRGAVVFLGTGEVPLPEDADLPLIRIAEGAPPPPRCAAVLTLTSPGRARLDHAGSSREVAVEAVSRAQADEIAAALAARSTRLGHRPDDVICLEDLSPQGGGRASLAAAIGMSAGAPVVVDLVADGPHAVVVGVTGSGKSELLTTWMTAMCRTRTPQELALLLVDFKGGRTFDALAGLPHVTGVLTDLDEERAVRAVESLRAEVRHRERVLAHAQARDIDGAGAALARLVIVVDEYAALVTARPELHELFGDIAARGRALGMHLVLASQRAGGAFRDGVLANAPLRIAFRVTDAGDSRTIIGQDDAVHLPGTAAARGSALLRCAADSAPRRIRVALCRAETIAAVRAAASALAPARRPWLPPLPERIGVGAVRSRTEASAAAIVLGISDEPEHQRQSAVTLPADAAGLVVVGGAGSGRTSLLRTVAGQAAAPVWIPEDPEGAWDAVCALDEAPRGTVVLFDDADALVPRFGADHGAVWLGALERICREARGRGITLVVSVSRLSGTLGRVLELLPQRVMLPMATRADHVAAGGASGDFVPDAPAGRGRWGRTLVQFAMPDDDDSVRLSVAPLWGPRPVALGSARGIIGFVLAPGPRAALVRTACAREGIEIVDLADAARPAPDVGAGADGARAARAFVGSPEAWLAHWGALAHVREHGTLVVDAACAAEYRGVTGSRELPPFAAPGKGRAWLIEPGVAARRVRLPEG